MATVALSGIITPSNVVTASSTTTLTNKTLTAPTIASANLTTALTLAGAAGTNGQVLTSAGSGLPTWTTLSTGAGDHAVILNSGNGFGSTNTKIRRYTTTQSSVGTAITYADSATLGASFTINEAGIYAFSCQEIEAATGESIGVSINSTQLTTSIGSGSITLSTRPMFVQAGSAGGIVYGFTAIFKCAVNDIVRPHTSGNQVSTGTDTMVSIRKVGNV